VPLRFEPNRPSSSLVDGTIDCASGSDAESAADALDLPLDPLGEGKIERARRSAPARQGQNMLPFGP
jgi:hypothetical protein